MVLKNLIGNAVKFSEKGKVRVGLIAPDINKSRIAISIKDEGPGIPREQQQAIFEAFHRGITYGTQGLGLVLTIAARAADLLGITMSLQSEDGKGTEFILEFPPSAKDSVTVSATRLQS